MSSFAQDSQSTSRKQPRKRHPDEGHRTRLRDRLDRAGAEALADYEILELLLGFAIRGRDTKAPARAALARFKTLAAVLDADREELLQVAGIGPGVVDALRVVKSASAAYLRSRAAQGDLLSDPDRVADFCRMKYAGERNEVVAALLIDSGNRFRGLVHLAEGTVDRAAVFPRRVAEAALKKGVPSVILVHNHPSGCVSPSAEDRKVTEDVRRALETVGCKLVDHVIVGREGAYSFHGAGEL
ncbi:MAG: DNA repair protein RadC [Planctomycetes bacterium]|nr:DNA repair protein RadC [Planctomycetota bacterium]